MTDAGVQALADRCPSLESVNLMCCSKVTDAGVQALAKYCPSLESANLWWCVRALYQCTESLRVYRALPGATRWCTRPL